MIELPKEIVHMIRTIEDAGFEAYAVGGCVRDSILGRHPEDWDLTSNASRAALEALFPDAKIVNKKLGVMRLAEGDVKADIAAYRIDGEYKDYRRPETVIFTEEIDEDLRRRDFTMNAIAVSPERGVVDPYHGREDIESRLIRGIGDPRVRFEEDALRILRAIRFASQLDFQIDIGTFQAMKERVALLQHISKERILEEFTKTLTAPNSGKGLRLLLDAGVLPYILGEGSMRNVTDILGEDSIKNAAEAERKRLIRLSQHIDRTKPEAGLRIGLFYQCFEENRALAAIEALGYSNEMKKLLRYAVSLTAELEQIRDKLSMKRLLRRIGLPYYQYLTDLAEQRCTVCHTGEAGFEATCVNGPAAGPTNASEAGSADTLEDGLRHRAALFREIRDNNEPVFPGDLAVNGNDLRELGITEGVMIGRILKILLDTAHRFPEKNEKSALLKIAAETVAESASKNLK